MEMEKSHSLTWQSKSSILQPLANCQHHVISISDMLQKCVDKKLSSTVDTVSLPHCAVGILMPVGSYAKRPLGLLPPFDRITPHSISPQSLVPDKPCIQQEVNPALPPYSLFIIHADVRCAPTLMPHWQESAYLHCMLYTAWMQCQNFCRNLFANVSALSPCWGFSFVVCWIQVFLPSFSLD